MMKKMFFALFLPFMLQLSALDSSNIPSHSVCEAPNWVHLFDYDMSAPPSNQDKKDGYQNLLRDLQINGEENVDFIRISRRITSKKGAVEKNDFGAAFNPSFEQVHLHAVRVFRHGVWNDFLPKTKIKAEDGTEDLSREIYVEYRVSDLQKDDIVECQMSRKRLSPFLAKYINYVFDLRGWYEFLSFRIIASPTRNLAVKNYHTNKTLQVNDLSPSFREWSIQHKPELDGSWSAPSPKILITEYPSWYALATELRSMLNVVQDFTQNPSQEATELVQQWMEKSDDPMERACLAVRFVQDEFESYSSFLKGYYFTSLNQILDERSGEIFDKTLLLQGLLKLMGIESTPLLTARHETMIHDSLPQHEVFNCMILRIDFDDESIYVDPNAEDQFGPLDSNLLSESHAYTIGFPLTENTSGLITLPTEELKIPTKIVTYLTPIDSTHIRMEIDTVYYGPKANRKRTNLKYSDDDNHRLDILNIYYPGIEWDGSKQVDDNRALNTVTIREKFIVPIKSGQLSFKPEIFSTVYIYRRDTSSTEIQTQIHPEWVQEEIHVVKPRKEKNFPVTEFSHECLYYRRAQHEDETGAHYFYEIKTLDKEIKLEQVPSYNKIAETVWEQDRIKINF